MRFDVLTLFPEMINNSLSESILGRASAKGIIKVNAVNIRDFAFNKHSKVDDYTYGPGAGMLMQAEPVMRAYESLFSEDDSRKRARTIYVTPQGRTFDQKFAHELSVEDRLIILCGHYEGIDERVLNRIVTDNVSIGDYVLTGGELAAMVMIDAVARLVPGVLNKEESHERESFETGLLEYPQYSRPEVWDGEAVPKILLSGDHKKIEEWQLFEAIKRTKERRPDLYEKYKVRIIEEESALKPKKRKITQFIKNIENSSCNLE